MTGRITFEEWHARRLAEEPEFDKVTDEVRRWHGPRRKLDILVDESAAAVGRELEAVKDFRLHRVADSTPDRGLWAQARREGWVLVTADTDFWNDGPYPLRLSPGVIILVGRTTSERLFAFERLLVVWDLVANVGRLGQHILNASKVRTSRRTIEWKFFDNGVTVTLRQ